MTIKEFLDDLISFKPITNISFDKNENVSDLFVIAKNMLETSSKHIALAICYGFGFGTSKDISYFEKELYESLKFGDYRSYELLIKAYTSGLRVGKEVLKIEDREKQVDQLKDEARFLIMNYHNSKLGYKNLEELEEIKKLVSNKEERKKAYLENLENKKNSLIEKNIELSDKEIIETVKFLREEKYIYKDFLSELIRVSISNKKSKYLIRELVYLTLETIKWSQNPENLSVFPIRELIDNGYNLYALEMLEYCEHEDCTFLNGPKVFLLEAECYLNIKDFDKAYHCVCVAQDLMEDGEIYSDFLRKIIEEKDKFRRGIK